MIVDVAITHMKRGLARTQVEIEHMKASPLAKDGVFILGRKTTVGYTKTCCRALDKNTVQSKKLFALSNLWMARRHSLAALEQVRP